MRTLVLLLALSLSGCATFHRMEPQPEAKEALTVSVSKDPPSAMNDMPLGVYRIPESTTYISGHQKGQAAGMMFGLLGLAIAQGVDESRAKEKLKAVESTLTLDMATSTSAAFSAKIKERGLEKTLMVSDGTPEKGVTGLSITPFVVLTYVTETMARPFVVLKVYRRDARGSEIWWTRYVSAATEARPLAGGDGWTDEGGKAFKTAIAGALDTAVDVVVRDAAGQLPRSTGKDVKVKTKYGFVYQELELTGKLVETTDKSVVFIPKVGDVVVFAGVNIFGKDLVQITDAPAPNK